PWKLRVPVESLQRADGALLRDAARIGPLLARRCQSRCEMRAYLPLLRRAWQKSGALRQTTPRRDGEESVAPLHRMERCAFLVSLLALHRAAWASRQVLRRLESHLVQALRGPHRGSA